MHELLVVGFKDKYQAELILTETERARKGSGHRTGGFCSPLDKAPDGQMDTEQSFDLFSQLPTTGACRTSDSWVEW